MIVGRLMIIIRRVKLNPCGIRVGCRGRCPISLAIVAIIGPRILLPGRSCCGCRWAYVSHHTILRLRKLVIRVIGVLWGGRQLRELRWHILPLNGLRDLIARYLLLIGVNPFSFDRHRLLVGIVKVPENHLILSLIVRRRVLAG